MFKSFIIIVILLMNFTLSFGGYKSIFGEGQTRWHVFEMALDAGGTWIVYTENDTLINNKIYKKVMYKFSHSIEDSLGNSYFFCYIKEDTLTGQCWTYEHDWKGNTIETEIINMSLEKDDSIKIQGENISIDTVYFVNGRKIIELNKYHYCEDSWEGYKQKLKFIEGIGPSWGLPSLEINRIDDFTLLCKYENYELIYSTPDNSDNNCFLRGGASVEDKKLDKQIIIYPNPTTEKLSIEIIDFNAEQLFCNVYNVLGQKIQSEQIKTYKTELILENPGFYYFIITDGKTSQIHKLIVGR